MVLYIDRAERESWFKRCRVLIVATAVVALMISGPAQAEIVKQRSFASPDEAVKALVEALKSKDIQALEAIFGPGSKDLVSSGDPVSDKAGADRFISLYEEKNRLEEESAEKVILYLGNEDWPFAIPIVKKNALWHFDAKGRPA